MKKVLILLLVIGVLIGTFAIAEAFSEGISLDQGDFSEGEELTDPDPCGGGSGEGPGGVPG
ncbi:MAG: hypothetical protein HXS48_01865 [Theionarchaea archaeon]|nr:hypothetical protein [Theionarchaea archaeon]